MGNCFKKTEVGPRIIEFNQPNEKYCGNAIQTTKYNIITFLPKAILLQFTRAANFVYLITAIVQSIEVISSLNPITAVAPFIFVILIALIREAYQDYLRYKKDKQTNEQSTKILVDGNFVEDVYQWKDIKVGDFIRVVDGQMIPADMLLLYSTQQNSICYVQTSNLDGQSNLKTKTAFHEGITLYPEQFHQLQGFLEVEVPNPDLHQFEGTVNLNQGKSLIDMNNFLLRGTIIKNTGYIVGMVVYAGEDSKIMLNQGDTKHKISQVETRVNKIQFVLFLVLVILSIGCSVGYYNYHSQYGGRQEIFYLALVNTDFSMAYQSFLIFFTCFLLLSFIIPVSMNVALQAIKAFLGAFISFDEKMYYEPIDKRCNVLNMSIVEELGLVDYVLTDKTGTLTANEMKFRYVWINDKTYTVNQLLENHQRLDQKQDQFWRSVVICHDVVVDSVKKQFQGSSPDQVCFVQFASQIDYEFLKRTKNSIELKIKGNKVAYQYLNMIPFSSRKRMSVIVKDLQNNKIILFTKGADSAIFEKANNHDNRKSIIQSLQAFSKQGLRTLVFSFREVSNSEYTKFQNGQAEIKNMKMKGLKTKEELQAIQLQLIENIQTNLNVIGASAIEDRLQDGVPETIQRIEEAGIVVMMITGDKLQTAENIGYLSCFISREATVFRLRAGTDNILQEVKSILETMESRPTEKYSVLIEGDSIKKIAGEEDKAVQQLLRKCKSVIFCRSTPKQKASIVKFVKTRLGGIVLAIGDGGNDVGMIQQANVGVGLIGKQGNQAASSSDFYFGQFRFLDRLLFHHGRWAYYRMSYFFVYYGWKNLIMTILIFFFMIDSAFSGQPSFSELFISLYNAFIGMIILVYYSIFQQDINSDMYPPAHKKQPIFYRQFKAMNLFSYRRYVVWTVLGVILAVFINYLINESLGAIYSVDSDGHPADFKSQAEAGALGLSIGVIGIVLVDIYNFTCFTSIFVIFLLTIVACWLIFILENFLDIGTVTGALTDNANLRFWAVIIMISAVPFAFKHVTSAIQFIFYPSETQKEMKKRSMGVIREEDGRESEERMR